MESLTGTFQAIHQEIADILYPSQPSSFFTKINLFVFFAQYVVPSREGLHGKLEDLSVPLIDSLEWETPDNTTMLSFKTKISQDIQKAMKPGKISRRIRLSWFVPLHIFVACFRSLELQRTNTMWLNRRLPEEHLDSVVGEMWKTNERFHLGDTIRCKASPNSLAISYQISVNP